MPHRRWQLIAMVLVILVVVSHAQAGRGAAILRKPGVG